LVNGSGTAAPQGSEAKTEEAQQEPKPLHGAEAWCKFCGHGPMLPWQVQHHYRECDKGGREHLEKLRADKEAAKKAKEAAKKAEEEKKAAEKAAAEAQKAKPPEAEKPGEAKPEEPKKPGPWGEGSRSIPEILEGVLHEHGVSDEAIKYEVGRAERMQGVGQIMDGNELQRDLLGMKIGIPRERINLVVRDYLENVQWEAKRAQDRQAAVSWPTGAAGYPPQQIPGGWPSPMGTTGTPGTIPPTFTGGQPGTQMSPGYQYAFGGGITPQQIQQMISETIAKEIAKKDEVDRLAALEKQRIQDRADADKRAVEAEKKASEQMTELKEWLGSQLAATKEKPGEVKPLSREELLEIMDKQQKGEYMKYLEERMRHDKEQHDAVMAQLKEERKATQEEKAKLLEKLEEARSSKVVSTEGYHKDETRLVADALHILGQRQPIEKAGKVLEVFLRPAPAEQPPERESSGPSGVADILLGTDEGKKFVKNK